MSERHPRVQGRCPACRLHALFLGEGGHLTCSNIECPMPDTMLAYKIRETGLPFRRKGDRLPTGEEFIGYTDDGTPMWNEPVGPPPPQRIEVDDYEISNLREGLLTLREIGCDTGDWLGQILNKLPDTTTVPNKTVVQQIGRVVATLDRCVCGHMRAHHGRDGECRWVDRGAWCDCTNFTLRTEAQDAVA